MKPTPEYEPTPEQIREAAAEERSKWSESTRRSRAGECRLSKESGLRSFRMPRVIELFPDEREFLRSVEKLSGNPTEAR